MEYDVMQNIIIDEEFKALLPPLDPLELEGLTQNILEHGCKLPLILWNNILIDGYNRHEICTEQNLPFNTIDMEFNSRDDVKEWIIDQQISRRNLTPMQYSIYRGMLYNFDKKSHGGDRLVDSKIASCQNDNLLVRTADKLSDRFNISPRTIIRDAEMAKVVEAIGHVSLDAKREVLLGNTGITRKKLRELSTATNEKIEEIANSIKDGTFDVDMLKTEQEKQQTISAATDYINDVVKSLITPIVSAANIFGANLSKLSQTSEKKDVKAMLRSYIDDLEKMYDEM
jgi:hypothetical protein